MCIYKHIYIDIDINIYVCHGAVTIDVTAQSRHYSIVYDHAINVLLLDDQDTIPTL